MYTVIITIRLINTSVGSQYMHRACRKHNSDRSTRMYYIDFMAYTNYHNNTNTNSDVTSQYFKFSFSFALIEARQ